MRPAASIVLFTTLAGAGQGMAFWAAVAAVAGEAPLSLRWQLWVAMVLLVLGLGASFFHLGHPLRAWRAVLMWRTSWMSREVILLPLFIALVAIWALVLTSGPVSLALLLAWMVIPGALALWYCTAMIYACIRFIREWAHPLTIVNYVMTGLACGAVACGAVAALTGDAAWEQWLRGVAVLAIAVAWSLRAVALRRNARLKPKSTLQSATGLTSPRIAQKAMGMTGGSFNTREFFHGATPFALRMIEVTSQVLAFAAPLLVIAGAAPSPAGWAYALALQFVGLLADRWLFFAQAHHPQNLYYQAAS